MVCSPSFPISFLLFAVWCDVVWLEYLLDLVKSSLLNDVICWSLVERYEGQCIFEDSLPVHLRVHTLNPAYKQLPQIS